MIKKHTFANHPTSEVIYDEPGPFYSWLVFNTHHPFALIIRQQGAGGKILTLSGNFINAGSFCIISTSSAVRLNWLSSGAVVGMCPAGGSFSLQAVLSWVLGLQWWWKSRCIGDDCRCIHVIHPLTTALQRQVTSVKLHQRWKESAAELMHITFTKCYNRNITTNSNSELCSRVTTRKKAHGLGSATHSYNLHISCKKPQNVRVH